MDSEKQLIEQARHNKTAFRTLVETHKQQVYFLALDLTGNHQDAQDLSQEVFIKAYQSLARFRGESKLSSWLYRITVNCFVDTKRKKQVVVTSIDSEAAPTDPASRDYAADRRLEGKEIQRHIARAMAQLSPRERSVFVLRHYQDCSLKDIASLLNIAEGTVKSLLFRALQRLQGELQFLR